MTFIRTPAFWYRKDSEPAPPLERALTPLSYLYHAGLKMDRARKAPQKAPAPVICVGNLVAGGAGKTPTAKALMQRIVAHSIARAPAFLTRGHGGSEAGPLRVSGTHTAAQVGDEALDLAPLAATYIAKNRYYGAQKAAWDGADIIIMDDGFQNLPLHKDLSLLVIDGESGFGNSKLLPAGPLREPLQDGFAKADAFVMIGDDARNTAQLLPADKPLFRARIVPGSIDTSLPFIAFAGIGRPEKFFKTLEDIGASIENTHSFPDHYAYKRQDLITLAKEARDQNARLITTTKDFKRLSHLKGDIDIRALEIALIFDDETAIIRFLKERLS